jgi:EAL domain-containing protein (putative c-di-GMP-specific phosphodiesterase class I)
VACCIRHLIVIAAGVELEEHAKILRLLRYDPLQGYLISKRLACDAMMTYLPPKRELT